MREVPESPSTRHNRNNRQNRDTRRDADRDPGHGGRHGDEPRITVEMGGSNIVIRASSQSAHAHAATVVGAINAATETDVSIVVDPDPIPCDEAFAAYRDGYETPACTVHVDCRPVAAHVVAAGIVGFRTERRSWLLDVRSGRLCRHDGTIDVRFLPTDAWRQVVAVCITPARLVALMPNGDMVSARRAHAAAA